MAAQALSQLKSQAKLPSNTTPNTLAILPDATEDRRVRVTMAPGGKGLQLVQETFSPGVGWFSQAQVELSPAQVAELRDALGVTEFKRSARPTQSAAPLSVYRAG